MLRVPKPKTESELSMTITYDDHAGFIVINAAGATVASFDTYAEAQAFLEAQ